MSKLDLSDVRTAINDVINAQPDSSKTPWILLTHVGQTPKVKVVERGDDFSEFMDELSDGKLMYGYIKINLNGIMKGCYISWVPEGIDGVMKGKSTMWSKDMEFELKGKYHTQVSARNENDIDLEEIKKKLKVATGSSYALSSNVKNLSVNQAKDNIAKQQTDHLKGTGVQRVDSSYNSDALKQKSTDFWSKQHKEDEERKKQQESNSRNKTLPTPDLKQKSSEFWAQQQEEKKEQPTRTAPTADLSAKREQFWSQQQKEEEKKDMSSRPVTSVKGDVSSLRSKFMQAQVSEEQKSYAPPPRQTVQSKFQREPEPEPEPEPVRPPVFKKQEEEVPSYHQEPEQHQEEQQDEFNDDNQYQQEQQYYREPEPEPQPNPVDEDEWGEEEKEEPASSFLPPPPTRASQQSDEPDYPKYKAAYDFEASDPEELSFSEGDVLYVIKSDDDWWTAAHISDPSRTGFVPGNYLEAL